MYSIGKIKKKLILLYRFIHPIIDPYRIFRGLLAYPIYLMDWWRYRRLSDSEQLSLSEAYPCLNDRISSSKIDYHYFYANGWAMRRIISQMPDRHIDVASQTMFANLLSGVLPVIYIDYRPLQSFMDCLTSCAGDILKLCFADESIGSLSCLHVAEHIGLGRYGEALNPNGTRQACVELKRVLKPGGSLYFALPIGKNRVCFNAHRIHSIQKVIEYFNGMELVELSGVHDDGSFVENVDLDEFSGSKYACGLFWLRKPSI